MGIEALQIYNGCDPADNDADVSIDACNDILTKLGELNGTFDCFVVVETHCKVCSSVGVTTEY